MVLSLSMAEASGGGFGEFQRYDPQVSDAFL